MPRESDSPIVDSRQNGRVTPADSAPQAAPAAAAAPSPPVAPVAPSRVPWWLTDVVLSLLVVAAAFAPERVSGFTPTTPLVWVLVLLPVLVLPFRRRWPRPALVVLLALFGAASLLGTLSLGIGVAISAAVYCVVTTSTRRNGFIAAAIAVAMVIMLSLPAAVGSVFEPRVLQFGFFIVIAAAAGDAARSRRAYVQAITERAERAERTREAEARRRVSEERLRIARDLHDVVAHQITVISLNAGVASWAIDTDPNQAKEALTTIRGASRTVLREIGDLMSVLRGVGIPAGGGTDALAPQPDIARLDELIAQFGAAGLEVQLRTEGDLSRVTGAVGVVAYRVVQEAPTNVLKHGAESRAHVLLEVNGSETKVTVTNPMRTAAVVAADPVQAETILSTGLGLTGLRERVASVRGTTSAGPTLAGWRVSATLPVPNEEDR